MKLMNRLSLERRVQILGILVEGGSLRSASRLADVSINTVTKLLVDIGQACEAYQIEKLVNLPCKRIQCDEIWSFVGAKQKNVPSDKKGQWGIGDVWTWTGICADTKLIASWLVADRSAEAARRFVSDLAGRLTNRVQVTSDGLKLYLDAVEQAFGADVDFAQLVHVPVHGFLGLALKPAGAIEHVRECPGALADAHDPSSLELQLLTELGLQNRSDVPPVASLLEVGVHLARRRLGVSAKLVSERSLPPLGDEGDDCRRYSPGRHRLEGSRFARLLALSRDDGVPERNEDRLARADLVTDFDFRHEASTSRTGWAAARRRAP